MISSNIMPGQFGEAIHSDVFAKIQHLDGFDY
jgi:hypothetical protein